MSSENKTRLCKLRRFRDLYILHMTPVCYILYVLPSWSLRELHHLASCCVPLKSELQILSVSNLKFFFYRMLMQK